MPVATLPQRARRYSQGGTAGIFAGMKIRGKDATRPLKGILAIALTLCSSAAMALGLGDIRVLSRPGQPLVAEIPVISSDPGELENARVGLASAATFARVGLERPQGLAGELQFEFAQNAQGRAVIRVTSKAPVQVQALSFLIEVDWGKGRLVREYSALVDAPNTAAAIAEPAIEAPQAALPNTIIRDPEPLPLDEAAAPAPAPVASAPQVAPAPVPVAPVAAAPAPRPVTGGQELAPVQRGQTLSQIAGELSRGSGYSVNQTMVALMRANPEAFIRGNVNLLKQGAVLRTPHQDELAQINAAEATAIVREQAAQWRQARAPVPQPAEAGSAPASAPVTAAAAAPKATDARLEIAPAVGDTAQNAGTTTGLAAGGEGDMLANEQLRQAKEDLATRDAELQELRDRVAELEKLQQQQQALIAMKDSDLAAAQQRSAQSPQNNEAGLPAWLWGGVVLLAVAGVAWLLSRRRKPSPLPPLSRHGLDSAALAAAMPEGRNEPVELPTLEERDEDVAASQYDGQVAEAPFVAPVDEVVEETVKESAPVEIPGFEVEPETIEDEAWRDADPARIAPLNPAPAGRERLELAIAYMDLGDAETARTLLQEVAVGGDEQARAEAVELLGRL